MFPKQHGAILPQWMGLCLVSCLVVLGSTLHDFFRLKQGWIMHVFVSRLFRPKQGWIMHAFFRDVLEAVTETICTQRFTVTRNMPYAIWFPPPSMLTPVCCHRTRHPATRHSINNKASQPRSHTTQRLMLRGTSRWCHFRHFRRLFPFVLSRTP